MEKQTEVSGSIQQILTRSHEQVKPVENLATNKKLGIMVKKT
jgi:hypothetical protein